jgi:hypothetical protein
MNIYIYISEYIYIYIYICICKCIERETCIYIYILVNRIAEEEAEEDLDNLETVEYKELIEANMREAFTKVVTYINLLVT